ncbi:S66 family peptidase [Paenibacillus durus]|uniref:Peptidase S66 n=1 Tax=Paenibacillus durus ATCC 35681 TaxID=1333534 RepID=A0A0F7FAI6_PAEDU|nr:S66 peptidase family protein [Paenibacillus durus]AKG35592.1 peptidase S66 [Paenibacillus durus ATCC 35681]
MQADKLKQGDEIRVIAPSRSLSLIRVEQRELAKKKLEQLGYRVTFSKYSMDSDEFDSSSVEARIEDLHDAFRDPKVKGILTAIGGFNSNQLLPYIDYSLIKSNPKRLCGYSDITAISSAIYSQTGLITYSGPHFSTFGMLQGNEYTVDCFNRLMTGHESIQIRPSDYWSDDAWYADQERRTFFPNEGPYIINEGDTSGVIIGGNLCTLNLLQGTMFMPDLAGAILFVEDDYESSPATFDRDLQSLIHQADFNKVKGLVIGRFQQASQMTRDLLTKIIKTKKELVSIPVIADVDFGHTTPMLTFPIGGQAKLKADEGRIDLIISESIR